MHYTRTQILEHAAALDSIAALRVSNGNRLSLVRTQVYDSILMPGGAVKRLKRSTKDFPAILLPDGTHRPAHRQDNCYGAAYVRVSTDHQVLDGLSADEQVEALVDYFVDRRESFCLFADNALSGNLPHNDPVLIQRIRDHKADMYECVYRAVFARELSDTDISGGAEQYLTQRLITIRNGGYLDAGLDPDHPQKARDRTKIDFRAGLTAMVQTLAALHTIAVTDLSRFSRNDMLTGDLLTRMADNMTVLHGIYQDLSGLNTSLSDPEAALVANIKRAILTYSAGRAIWEVLFGSLRGQRQKLSSGEPVGKLPGWFVPSGSKRGQLIPERAEQVRAMIDAYLATPEDDGEEAGYSTVAKQMGENEQTVGHILTNPALIGCQEWFGILWPCLTPLATADEWKDIQAKVKRRREDHDRREKTERSYLVSGLFFCSCKARMEPKADTDVRISPASALVTPVFAVRNRTPA